MTRRMRSQAISIGVLPMAIRRAPGEIDAIARHVGDEDAVGKPAKCQRYSAEVVEVPRRRQGVGIADCRDECGDLDVEREVRVLGDCGSQGCEPVGELLPIDRMERVAVQAREFATEIVEVLAPPFVA